MRRRSLARNGNDVDFVTTRSWRCCWSNAVPETSRINLWHLNPVTGLAHPRAPSTLFILRNAHGCLPAAQLWPRWLLQGCTAGPRSAGERGSLSWHAPASPLPRAAANHRRDCAQDGARGATVGDERRRSERDAGRCCSRRWSEGRALPTGVWRGRDCAAWMGAAIRLRARPPRSRRGAAGERSGVHTRLPQQIAVRRCLSRPHCLLRAPARPRRGCQLHPGPTAVLCCIAWPPADGCASP